MHWNLPSNPVDLEQREGRINRYDGLSIRRNIASDFPLAKVRPGSSENLWASVFRMLGETSRVNGRFKHGLFPHWIYQSEGKRGLNGQGQPIIRRHLLFYTGSRDLQHYSDLKSALALYRLVFGQPRQQDILEQVVAKRQEQAPQDISRTLAKYMINLSPFGPQHAIQRARAEAQRILRDPRQLSELLLNVPKHLLSVPALVLGDIEKQVADLVKLARSDGAHVNQQQREQAVAAILYLLDPYDAVHDRHGIIGHVADVRVVRQEIGRAHV